MAVVATFEVPRPFYDRIFSSVAGVFSIAFVGLKILVASAGAFVALNAALFVINAGRVPLFAHVNGQNIGFETTQQAKSRLAHSYESRNLQLRIGGDTHTMNAQASGVQLDLDASITQTQVQNGWQRLPLFNIFSNLLVNYEPHYNIDHTKLKQSLSNIVSINTQMVTDQIANKIRYDNSLDVNLPTLATEIQATKATDKFDLASVVPVTSAEGLQKLVESFASSQGVPFKVSVIEISGKQRTAAFGQNDSMKTASTYKLFAAYSALKGIERGQYSFGTQTGQGTLDYCLQQMILVSDNNCGEAVGGLIGWTALTNQAHAAGFTSTILNDATPDGNLRSTASDEANFLKKLQNGQLLAVDHTKYLLDLMKRQIFRSGIPAGSRGAAVADKIGTLLTGVTDDAGIVYGPKSTYVIVVMSGASNFNSINALSAQVYDYLNR